jgi:hypothetical protein
VFNAEIASGAPATVWLAAPGAAITTDPMILGPMTVAMGTLRPAKESGAGVKAGSDGTVKGKAGMAALALASWPAIAIVLAAAANAAHDFRVRLIRIRPLGPLG